MKMSLINYIKMHKIKRKDNKLYKMNINQENNKSIMESRK